MNTRNSLLCSKCQDPMADSSEMRKYGFTNLGLRTAADGEINGTKPNRMINVASSETLMNLKSLKDQAYIDHRFLDEESQYLQSIASKG